MFTQTTSAYKSAEAFAKKIKEKELRTKTTNTLTHSLDTDSSNYSSAPFSLVSASDAASSSDEFSILSGPSLAACTSVTCNSRGSSSSNSRGSGHGTSTASFSVGHGGRSSAWDDANFIPTKTEKCKAQAESYIQKVIEEQERRRQEKQDRIIQYKAILQTRVETKNRVGMVLAMNNLKHHEYEYEHISSSLVDLNALLHEMDMNDHQQGKGGQGRTSSFAAYRHKVQTILTSKPASSSLPTKTYSIKDNIRPSFAYLDNLEGLLQTLGSSFKHQIWGSSSFSKTYQKLLNQ